MGNSPRRSFYVAKSNTQSRLAFTSARRKIFALIQQKIDVEFRTFAERAPNDPLNVVIELNAPLTYAPGSRPGSIAEGPL